MNNIYNISYSGFVLGSLMNNLGLLYNSSYPLDKYDFEPFIAHKIIFVALTMISDSSDGQVEEVEPKEIAELLKSHPSAENSLIDSLSNGNYVEYLTTLKKLDNDKAYVFYYNEVRKRSLLREYKDNGYDITPIFDEGKDIKSQDAKLNEWSIEDIIEHFEKPQNQIRMKYLVDDDTSRKKAGEGGKDVLVSFKTNPKMGLPFADKYLTTLWGGFQKKQLYIRSGDTSSGKSRSTIADLGSVCLNQFYDLEKNEWVDNPIGHDNNGLYIGCEMTLEDECDPLFWAYISGVESSKIMEGAYTEEEAKRIERAIEILEESNIWLTDMPSFNIRKLEEEIKYHKSVHNIDFVAFDYILLNSACVKEFAERRGGGSFRGDDVLLELSKALKDLAKKYDVGIITATQTNADIKDFHMRDYQVIRGGKAVADKATGGSISMPITTQELKLVEPYIEKKYRNFKNSIQPNFVETVYKSRFSKYPKECKIFSYYNLGNMRKIEMFVTDKNFKQIDVPKTIVTV